MKLVGYITACLALITALSGFAYKAFSWDRQIQQNSRAISLFILEKVERRIDYLQDKLRREGRLHPSDCRQLRDMLRQKADYECRLYKICERIPQVRC